MDLRSGQAFWPRLSGAPKYPALSGDTSCDVAIVGAGLAGAIAAHELTGAGLDCLVLDRRAPGCGSTAASTALLLYDLDVPLHQLQARIGEEAASRCYRLGVDAIAEIERLSRSFPECGFERRPSLYLASNEKDAGMLAIEVTARRHAGLEAQLLSRSDLQARSSIDAPCAILGHGAQVDGFALAHALLRASGSRVHGETRVASITPDAPGFVLKTSDGFTVNARKVVIAAGYEGAPLLHAKGKIVSTYAVATKPLQSFEGWEDRSLIWESARPYLYLRTTPDGRALIGGGDEPISDPEQRDQLVTGKMLELMRRFRGMFPAIAAEAEIAWAGFFMETDDSLPYIGEAPGTPGLYAALCYGANGTTFAAIAGRIIRELIVDGKSTDAPLFRLDR